VSYGSECTKHESEIANFHCLRIFGNSPLTLKEYVYGAERCDVVFEPRIWLKSGIQSSQPDPKPAQNSCYQCNSAPSCKCLAPCSRRISLLFCCLFMTLPFLFYQSRAALERWKRMRSACCFTFLFQMALSREILIFLHLLHECFSVGVTAVLRMHSFVSEVMLHH